jgi:hypothetical protein
MITRMNDDIQGGICYGGIAHAGPPRFRRAMWFDGGNDYVHAPSLSLPSYTLAARVYIHDTAKNLRGIAICSNAAIDSFSKRLRMVYGSPLQYSYTDIVLSNNQWYNVAATWDGVTPSLYLNGVVSPIVFTAEWTYTMPTVLGIGRSIITYDYIWYGVIKSLVIYNRALSSGEILSVIGGTLPSVGLVRQYDCTGHTLSDWQDLSGNANHIVTIGGTPEICYILGNGKITKNGVIMNP